MNIMQRKFAIARDEPVIDSLARTDMYKVHMANFAIEQGVHDTPVTFGFFNRSKTIRHADIVPEAALREQLDHTRTLRFTPAEASFLQGMSAETPHGRQPIYRDYNFTDRLLAMRVADYELRVVTGEFDLRTTGTWFGNESASLSEIPDLTTMSELTLYFKFKQMLDSNDITMSEIAGFFNRMEADLVEQAKAFRDAPSKPTMSPQGLRRPAALQQSIDSSMILLDILGDQCVGVSDIKLAMDIGSANPIGSFAHELSIIWPTLFEDTDHHLRESQFDLAERLIETYGHVPHMLTLLPDTYGTRQFFAHASGEIARRFTSYRPDSLPTLADADRLYSEFLRHHNADKSTKNLLASDRQSLGKFPALHAVFAPEYNKCSAGIGGGTSANFKGFIVGIEPANIVSKPIFANGRPTVKIGDAEGYAKLTGVDDAFNQRAIHAFSNAGWAEHCPPAMHKLTLLAAE